MKIVLLTLSGDATCAREKLANEFPDASLEIISRAEFEAGSLRKRLATLRARRPEVFVIVTESIAWQRGRSLFMLFGALAGAREVFMIDTAGNMRRRSRASLLMSAPPRLSREALASTLTVAHAKRELAILESAVQKRVVEPKVRPADRLRVVYLRSTPGPGTQAGGAASHIKGVVDSLVELGNDVQVISNDHIAGFDSSKAPLTVIEPRASGGTRAVFDIHNNRMFTHLAVPLIRRERPDLIYQRYARFSWVGVAAALKTNRPLFLEYNGSEVWVGHHWDRVGKLDLLERYERLNLSAATRVFVVSEVEQRNLERIGLPAEKVILNPNGVDTDVFQPGVGGATERHALGFGTAEVVVGFVGTFGPWHGVTVLAEAIKSIPPSQPLRFLLVGSGSLRGEVEMLLRQEIETRRVIFTGAVDHQRVPALLDACDVLVAPHVPLAEGNEFFGSPTKLFEYMAMGKAVVASRLGQLADVIVDGESGLLVEPGNSSQLRDALLRLADAVELRNRLGESARRQAVSKHTWRQNAQRIMDAYYSWLDS